MIGFCDAGQSDTGRASCKRSVRQGLLIGEVRKESASLRLRLWQPPLRIMLDNKDNFWLPLQGDGDVWLLEEEEEEVWLLFERVKFVWMVVNITFVLLVKSSLDLILGVVRSFKLISDDMGDSDDGTKKLTRSLEARTAAFGMAIAVSVTRFSAVLLFEETSSRLELEALTGAKEKN